MMLHKTLVITQLYTLDFDYIQIRRNTSLRIQHKDSIPSLTVLDLS